MKNVVYYLPRIGGRLSTGLAAALLVKGLDLAGRDTVKLRFLELEFAGLSQALRGGLDLKARIHRRD